MPYILYNDDHGCCFANAVLDAAEIFLTIRKIQGGCIGGITSEEMVKEIQIDDGGIVDITIYKVELGCTDIGQEIVNKLLALKGVSEVNVRVLDEEWDEYKKWKRIFSKNVSS